MHTLTRTLGIAAVTAALLLLVRAARADYVELNDGRVVEGTVLKTGDGYWVKTKDGETQKFKSEQIKSTGKGSKPARGGTAAGPARPPGIRVGDDPTKPPGSHASAEYTSTERRANAVDAPMAAVILWQKFIDSKPAAEDLTRAKAELAKWQKLADGGAEKIKGKWVGGEERKAIVKKAQGLYLEATRMMSSNQSIGAIEKLKEAVAVYPNDFYATFALGYLNLLQDNPTEARKYLEAAQKIRPNSPEVLANLAVLEVGKRQYINAIEMLYKAVQQGDNKVIAQNLIAALAAAPPAMASSDRTQKARDAAALLGTKYNLPMSATTFYIVPLRPEEAKGAGKADPLAAGMVSGSGFLISKDGLILTNRHVVEHGKSFLVMINGKRQRSAEIVVIDDDQDLALIRVKADAGEELPTVDLASADAPGDGAACTVMGYPLIDRLGASIKITRGVVSSSSAKFEAGPDIVVDAKVNPGNSGGPILDKHGNVMAIVSMKTVASAMEDTYGLGISAGRIRKFLKKVHVEIPKAGAESETKTLDTEEIAAKVKPAAVCILSTR